MKTKTRSHQFKTNHPVSWLLGIVIVSTFHLNLPATEVLTPREAVVSVKNGLLRSGPDEKYYPTRILETGELLEVYRVIDNQWYGVRPPRGSFSWVDARFVQLLGNGDVGMVVQDNVHARIGSELGNMCGATNVWLNKGDRIAIYERVDTPSDHETPIWYKIAPPAGEFRWVHKDHIHFDDVVSYSDIPKPLYAYPRKSVIPTAPPIIQVGNSQEEVGLELTMEDFRLVLNDLKLEFSNILITDSPDRENRLDDLAEEVQMLYDSAPTTLEQDEIKSLLTGIQRAKRERADVSSAYQSVYLDERSTSNRQIVMPMEENVFQPYYEINGVRYHDPSGMMPMQTQVYQPNMQQYAMQPNQVSRQAVPQKKQGGWLSKLGFFTSQGNIAEKQPNQDINISFRQIQQQGNMRNDAGTVFSQHYIYFEPDEAHMGSMQQSYPMMQTTMQPMTQMVNQPMTVQEFARQQSPQAITQQMNPRNTPQMQVVSRPELQYSGAYDVVGWLGRVKGTQTYAIEDESGRQYLVSPPRGVNLENYLGDVVGMVGISGQRGMVQDSGIPHIAISSAPQVIPKTNRK